MNDIRWVILIALAVASCDKEAAVPVAATPAATTAQAAEPTPAVEPAAVKPLFVEADAQALVTAWIAAQNSSDFDAYQKLYAAKFEGIKRVGAKKFSYAREGWLKDRKRMFAKKMDVSAADVEIALAGRSAIARFEQTWASGTFKDVGPKQLVLVLEGDVLRISREEMLESTLVGAAAAAIPEYDPRRLALLAGPDAVVLRRDTANIAAGTPKLISRSGEAIANLAKPSPELQKFVGESFVVIGSQPECTAKVKSLHLLARAVPHFGQEAYWAGEVEGQAKLSDAQVAAEIWELASGPGHVLIGRLDKACKGGEWAHGAQTKPDALLKTVAAGALAASATAAFRALPGFKAIQQDYEATEKSKAPWHTEGRLDVVGLGSAGTPQYVAVVAMAGAGCGGFIGEFWALFEVAKGGALVLLTDPKAPGAFFEPSGAVISGGIVSFFSATTIVQKVGPIWRQTHDVTVPFYGCPC